MEFPYLEKIISTRNLRIILQDNKLAQLGDFLANFIYSSVWIGMRDNLKGIHVWDYSLKKAMDLADLRSILGKRTKPDKVADAAEAILGYAYFKKMLTLNEMIEILEKEVGSVIPQSRIEEKDLCANAFAKLLLIIVDNAVELNYIDY